MPRILLLIILIWVLYMIVKRFLSSSATTPSPTETKKAEKIVACHHCGLHVPESESHMVDDLIFCNNENCQQIKQ